MALRLLFSRGNGTSVPSSGRAIRADELGGVAMGRAVEEGGAMARRPVYCLECNTVIGEAHDGSDAEQDGYRLVCQACVQHGTPSGGCRTATRGAAVASPPAYGDARGVR